MLRVCFFQAVCMPVIPQASGQADQGYETNQSKDELVSQSSRIVVDQKTCKGSEEHIGKKPDQGNNASRCAYQSGGDLEVIEDCKVDPA